MSSPSLIFLPLVSLFHLKMFFSRHVSQQLFKDGTSYIIFGFDEGDIL